MKLTSVLNIRQRASLTDCYDLLEGEDCCEQNVHCKMRSQLMRRLFVDSSRILNPIGKQNILRHLHSDHVTALTAIVGQENVRVDDLESFNSDWLGSCKGKF